MLAALGVLENSTVIIIASILVSPLMNSILDIVFGLSMRENSLWQQSLRNELIGLIICLINGFILGFFTTFVETDRRNSTSFSTSEMKLRGSLFGVAVSGFKCINNDYQPFYTCNISSEAVILICCSLLLIIVNIICIIIMVLTIFRIKEVVLLHQSNKNITKFFHYDVKIARDYNKIIHENDSNETNFTTTNLRRNDLSKSIINQWKSFKLSLSVNVDLESNNNNDNLLSNDMKSQRKLFRFKLFTKEYDLDIFNRDDYHLTNSNSREKVRLLVNDLVDICQEMSSIFVDLYCLQSLGTQLSSTNKEYMSFLSRNHGTFTA
ncbi:unnamed protein product [Rotaria sp. Silwood2]|nr:unnamed protein product [Rotaria sp. Silwood2]CAF4041669.1 unnamed protein product [Rotaria sp. Silwood2]